MSAMTIGRRIALGYVVVLLFAILSAATGLFTFSLARQSFSTFLAKDDELLKLAHSLKLSVTEQNEAFRGFLMYGNEDTLVRWREKEQEFDRLVEQMQPLIDDESQRGILRKVMTSRDAWTVAQARPIELKRQANDAEALAVAATEVQPVLEEVRDQIKPFMEHYEISFAEAQQALSATLYRASVIVVVLPALALLVAIACSLWITRNIARQLREAISKIASSASEISTMASQMAASAAETATAVSETSSTVEEVKQTAHVSSQKAKIVSETSQRMVDVARGGKGAVEASTEGMRQIRVQMDSIAASIVQLSEQGQAIGEIIAAVNDLAEQSNLLAVNAAIEAARAGEQGRSFGVVAQEVKSLAEQSKQATAQVRGILSDIQKATGSAVMVTEQGSKAVDTGVRQAAEAGQAIRQLSENLSEGAQAAVQIAASSQQQLAGMDQVTVAMENIRLASVQNAAGTKQAEEAARLLKGLAQDLNAMIEKPRA